MTSVDSATVAPHFVLICTDRAGLNSLPLWFVSLTCFFSMVTAAEAHGYFKYCFPETKLKKRHESIY